MIIKYALVEDDIEFYSLFKIETEKELNDAGLDYYQNPVIFLENCRNGKNYDVLLLDIDMPEMDGISLAKELYSFNQDTIIIFLTNKTELVFQAFGLNVLAFIPKQDFHERKKKIFSDISECLLRKSPLLLNMHHEQYLIKRNEIICIEKRGRDLLVYTPHRVLQMKRITLDELLEKLQTNNFQYANRSVIVNMQYVSKITKNTVDLEVIHKTVDLSRGKQKELVKLYLKR